MNSVNPSIRGPYSLVYAGEKSGPVSDTIYEDVEAACRDAGKQIKKEAVGVAIRVVGTIGALGYQIPAHAAIYKG